MALAWYSLWLGIFSGIWLIGFKSFWVIVSITLTLALIANRRSFFLGLFLGQSLSLMHLISSEISNDISARPMAFSSWQNKYVRKVFLKQRSEPSPQLAPIRNWVRARLVREEAPLASCLRTTLVLGDGDCISRETWKTFNHLGLSHILVLSGSHLVLLTVIFSSVLKMFFKRIQMMRFVLILIVTSFFILAEEGASLWRAFLGVILMSGLSLFLPFIHRFSSLDRLAIVGSVLLVLNVRSAFDLSYLLSFGATAAILMMWEGSTSVNWRKLLCAPAFLLAPLTSALKLKTSFLSPFINLIFLPFFGLFIVPVTFIPLVFTRLDQPVENILKTIYWGMQAVNLALKQTLFVQFPSVGVSLFFLILALTLGPRLKAGCLWYLAHFICFFGIQLLKVRFDI